MHDLPSDRPIATDRPSRRGGHGLGWAKRLLSADQHWGFALLDQGVVSATSLLTTIVVGRYCGSDGLGLFALALSLLYLATGTQASLVSTPFTVFFRRRSKSLAAGLHSGAAFVGATILIASFTLIAATAAVAIQLLSGPGPNASIAWGLTFAIAGFLAREFARRFDFARMQMRTPLVVDCGVTVLQIGLLLLLGSLGWLTSSTAVATVGGACLIVFAIWVSRRRQWISWHQKQTLTVIAHDWRFGRWLLTDHVICFAQLYGMHWLLSALLEPAATGILTACMAISNLANPFLYGVGNYLGPRFAETVSSGSRTQTLRLYWRTTLVLAIGVVGFTGIAILFGQSLLDLLYSDPAYNGYGWVVTLLAVRLAFAVPTIAADHAVIAMEFPRGSAIATLVGLLATLIAAVPLVSIYQVSGAAMAMLIGTGLESLVMIIVFVRYLKHWNWQADRC